MYVTEDKYINYTDPSDRYTEHGGSLTGPLIAISILLVGIQTLVMCILTLVMYTLSLVICMQTPVIDKMTPVFGYLDHGDMCTFHVVNRP